MADDAHLLVDGYSSVVVVILEMYTKETGGRKRDPRIICRVSDCCKIFGIIPGDLRRETESGYIIFYYSPTSSSYLSPSFAPSSSSATASLCLLARASQYTSRHPRCCCSAGFFAKFPIPQFASLSCSSPENSPMLCKLGC